MKFTALFNGKKVAIFLSTLVLVVSSFVLSAAPASAETYTVKMGTDKGLLQFAPRRLTVKPGDTIVWLNNKVPPHNVVFDPVNNPTQDAALAASLSHKKLLLEPRKEMTTEIPADAPAGEYTFYCQPHRGAGMSGKLIVEP